MDVKACLRRQLAARRAVLPAGDIQHKSVAIAARVCALPAFVASRTVMVYMALPQEVQTVDIIARARQQQRRVVVPVVHGATLLAVELPEETTQLRRGPFGILEPTCQDAVVHPAEIDFVVVPGLAFDRYGGRLGFGKGYYDRFLCQLHPGTCTCGVAFCLQVVPWVPRLPHDVCVSYIVTEQESIACGNPAACRPD
jgi:5-formyltetrahydrofolate cyclo-ligase